MNAPQYFATGPPDQPPHTPQHEYYPQLSGPPMPPPPPLPEPPGTSNVSLDPMLQQPHQLPHAPPPPIVSEPQGSEAIINAAKAERTAQDRERGRLRVQRFRMKRKLADAEAGRRDKDTLKKIKFPAAEAPVSAGLDYDQTSALGVDASYLGDPDNGPGPSTPRRAGSSKDTEAEVRERERGRLRVQAYRLRKKLAEAKDGVRDAVTLKKIRSGKNGEILEQPMSSPIPATYTHRNTPHIQGPMPYAQPMFIVPVEASGSMLPPLPPPESTPTQPEAIPIDAPPPFITGAIPSNTTAPAAPATPATASRQRAVRTNWFHPTRWSTINAAGLRANFSSAHEIVRLAKLAPGGEDIFKTLDRGTVHKWIDKERGGWNESVLEKVRKAAVKEAESWDTGRGPGEGIPVEGVPLESIPVESAQEANVSMAEYLGGVPPEVGGAPSAVETFEGQGGVDAEHGATATGGNA
ncbi:hypothetical protein BDV93DRAFT_609978 [Ceratobasidium sp. AG-I]|nr:hypothetical protein BDV93DRAFT_609978 [Ceratobasidium sp. AG-I]